MSRLLSIIAVGVVLYYVYNKNSHHHDYSSYKNVAEKYKHTSKLGIDKDNNLNKVYGHHPNLDFDKEIIRRPNRRNDKWVYV